MCMCVCVCDCVCVPMAAEGVSESVPYYRIVIIGESGVGVTSFILRIIKGRFPCTNAEVSLSLRHNSFEHEVDGENVKVALEEPAGSERLHCVNASFYRHVHAVILMYNVSEVYSFEGLEHMAKMAGDCIPEDREITWALFGNKCDRFLDIDHIADKVAALSESITGNSTELCNLHFIVSAKTGEGAMNAITQVIEAIHRKQKSLSLADQRNDAIITVASSSAPVQAGRQSCCI